MGGKLIRENSGFPGSTKSPNEVCGHSKALFASHMTSVGTSAAGMTQATSDAAPKHT